MVSLRAIELTKQFLSCQVVSRIGDGTHGVVVVYIVVGDKNRFHFSFSSRRAVGGVPLVFFSRVLGSRVY